jgi:ABC-2 type transport system permease protein
MSDLRLYSHEYLRDKVAFVDAIASPLIMILLFGAFLSIPAFTGGASVSMSTFAPGLLSIVTGIAPMQAMTATSARYKKAKLFKQLSLTPITKMEWLSSKALWFLIITALSFVPSVATAVFVFGAHVSLTLWIMPFLALGTIFFTLLGTLVGTLAKSPETANMVTYIILTPMLLLSGVILPVAFMPNYLQDIAHVLPQFYVVDGLKATMLNGDYAKATTDLAVVSVLVAIAFALVARFSKWRED